MTQGRPDPQEYWNDLIRKVAFRVRNEGSRRHVEFCVPNGESPNRIRRAIEVFDQHNKPGVYSWNPDSFDSEELREVSVGDNHYGFTIFFDLGNLDYSAQARKMAQLEMEFVPDWIPILAHKLYRLHRGIAGVDGDLFAGKTVVCRLYSHSVADHGKMNWLYAGQLDSRMPVSPNHVPAGYRPQIGRAIY